MSTSKFKFIDLFCGIGGFHQACRDLGGECVFASDIDEDCQRVYEKNYGTKPFGDITKIDAKDIPPHDLLCAGFPCQSFSKAGKRMGFKDETHGTLFFDIMRIVRYRKPKYILLENVRNLLGHDSGNTWRVIKESIEREGYNVAEPIIFSPHYLGIPQHRERVFIMAVRKDIGRVPEFAFNIYNLPPCSIENILINDNEIPNLKNYQLNQEYIDLINIWQEFLEGINCPPPTYPIWGDFLKPLENRKTAEWRQTIINKNANLYETNKEFIDDWLERAKKQRLFFGSKAKLEWQVGKVNKPNIWDNILQFRPSGIRVKKTDYFPALVAIAQTSVLGKRKRFLTPRECARLQSFPEDFIIDESDSRAYRQFGNAVNVNCAKVFVEMLLRVEG